MGFFGYPNNQKAWKLYDMNTHVFFVSHDVKLHEHEFPFASTTNESVSSVPSSCDSNVVDMMLISNLSVILHMF